MWILFLLPIITLFSAPIGNPTAPSLLEEGFFIPDTSWSNVQLGFTQDFLLQKLFRPSRTSPLQNIKKAELSGNAQLLEVVWNIKERLNLQAVAGPGSFEWGWEQPQGRLEGESDTGFFCAGTASLVLLEIKDTSLAAEGQVGSWNGAWGHVTLNGIAQSEKANVYFYYWQAGAALTQKIGPLAPYLGCMVNQTSFRAKHLQTGSARLRSLIIVGPFAGCTIGSMLASINIEWRGWFEEGISISGQVRF